MPRLSDYLRGSQQAAVERSSAPGTSAATPAPTDEAPNRASPETLQLLHERYLEQYRRRTRDRGPRAYRHPDGSLRPAPPAADTYSTANRVHWAELVSHCRTHGGDREYDTHGFSLRYGVGVPAEAHRRLCEALDLHEELAPPPVLSGDEGDPLADPSHAFNCEWKQLAEQVFAAAPRRALTGAV